MPDAHPRGFQASPTCPDHSAARGKARWFDGRLRQVGCYVGALSPAWLTRCYSEITAPSERADWVMAAHTSSALSPSPMGI